MDRFFKFASSKVICLMLILSAASFCFAETRQAMDKDGTDKGSLIIKNKKISVDFDAVPLRDILGGIKNQLNIWIKGNESILDEKTSVRFTDLSFEDGIKRILYSTNYVFVYHADGNLSGVMLFDKSSSERSYDAPLVHNLVPEIIVTDKPDIAPISPVDLHAGISTLKSVKEGSTGTSGRSLHMENFMKVE
ncbi:MAG: hypothetical protein JW882_19965 [Deltaproteobacteria bacterium]|nr:hypothetical protein [Deltaproteobacteria bacterium]